MRMHTLTSDVSTLSACCVLCCARHAWHPLHDIACPHKNDWHVPQLHTSSTVYMFAALHHYSILHLAFTSWLFCLRWLLPTSPTACICSSLYGDQAAALDTHQTYMRHWAGAKHLQSLLFIYPMLRLHLKHLLRNMVERQSVQMLQQTGNDYTP